MTYVTSLVDIHKNGLQKTTNQHSLLCVGLSCLEWRKYNEDFHRLMIAVTGVVSVLQWYNCVIKADV